MKYVVLNSDNTVAYTFPEVDPIRPNIPITGLYSVEFLSSCIKVEESVIVESGYVYDPTAGTFTAPVETETVTNSEEGTTTSDDTITDTEIES